MVSGGPAGAEPTREPDGYRDAEPERDGWEVLPAPQEPWPTLDSPVLPAPPPTRPTKQELYAAIEAQDTAAMSRYWPIDVLRTVWFEARGARGAEPDDLVTGGSMAAAGILTGLAAIIVAAPSLVDPEFLLFASVLLVIAVGLIALGYRRYRRGR